MRNILLTLLISCIVGFIDILPMIKMKLDKYAISSAFIFYFIVPFIIYNLKILENLWWLKGGFITFALSVPIIIIISKADKKSVIPIAGMAVILGTCIGVAGHFLNIGHL